MIAGTHHLNALVVSLPAFILGAWLLANWVTKTLAAAAAESRSIAENLLKNLVYTVLTDEQGHGFAVVADKVRELVEHTQKSTSEIKAVVESLHAGVSNAINIIRHSSDRAGNSTGQVQNSVAAFENITLIIIEINLMNEQIATSVTEQIAAVNSINKSVLSIREKAEAATHETQTVFGSAQSLADLVHALQGLTRRFRA